MSADKREAGRVLDAADGRETSRTPPRSGASTPFLRARALWIGSLGLAVLAAWLVGGSLETPPPHTGSPPAATGAPANGASAPSDEVRRAHEGGLATSPAAAAAIDELRRRVVASPDDRLARKELAVRLVEADRLVEAFAQAEQVLTADPNDLDGLYVEGEVRFAMGQVPQAVELLDRLLARYPGHLLALIARGKAAASLGRQAEAIGLWQRALIAAGGRYPPVEELLAQVGLDPGATADAAALRPVAAHQPESPLR